MERFDGCEFKDDINDILDELLLYVSAIPNDIVKNKIQNEIFWAKDYLKIKQDKLEHQAEETPDYTRGAIVLVKLGENLGNEFSGKHHAIVLRNCAKSVDQVFILPITSKKPRSYDPASKSIYVEIPKIPGFNGYTDKDDPNHPDTGKHWANILSIRNVSRKRIISPTAKFFVRGNVLDKISSTVMKHIAYRLKREEPVQRLTCFSNGSTMRVS